MRSRLLWTGWTLKWYVYLTVTVRSCSDHRFF
jgi:hypothetical protein